MNFKLPVGCDVRSRNHPVYQPTGSGEYVGYGNGYGDGNGPRLSFYDEEGDGYGEGIIYGGCGYGFDYGDCYGNGNGYGEGVDYYTFGDGSGAGSGFGTISTLTKRR